MVFARGSDPNGADAAFYWQQLDDLRPPCSSKFLQQHRLFFRYHAPSKVIVYARVNNEDTRRTYESADDAYPDFRKMLESGHPPDDWDRLLAEARAESARLQQVITESAAAQS